MYDFMDYQKSCNYPANRLLSWHLFEKTHQNWKFLDGCAGVYLPPN